MSSGELAETAVRIQAQVVLVALERLGHRRAGLTSAVGFRRSVCAAAALMLSRVSLLVLSVRRPAASMA